MLDLGFESVSWDFQRWQFSPTVIRKSNMTAAYCFLLELMVDGDNVVGFVRGLSTDGADAGVVGAAVDVQKTFVFLADLFLQVEGGLNQTV